MGQGEDITRAANNCPAGLATGAGREVLNRSFPRSISLGGAPLIAGGSVALLDPDTVRDRSTGRVTAPVKISVRGAVSRDSAAFGAALPFRGATISRVAAAVSTTVLLAAACGGLTVSSAGVARFTLTVLCTAGACFCRLAMNTPVASATGTMAHAIMMSDKWSPGSSHRGICKDRLPVRAE